MTGPAHPPDDHEPRPAGEPGPHVPPAPHLRALPSPRRGSLYALAWLAGTACAATILWQGVSSVRPPGGRPETGLRITAPPRDGATPGPGAARTGPPGKAPAAATPGGTPDRPPLCENDPGSGTPRSRSYRVSGGVVVLAQTRTGARLVEARPVSGWRRQFWCGIGWLRVDFSAGRRVTTLIATWNGHPPQVRFNEQP